MPSAFADGIQHIVRFEITHVGVTFDTIATVQQEMTLATVMVVIFLDGVLYGLVGVYLRNVIPGKPCVHILGP